MKLELLRVGDVTIEEVDVRLLSDADVASNADRPRLGIAKELLCLMIGATENANRTLLTGMNCWMRFLMIKYLANRNLSIHQSLALRYRSSRSMQSVLYNWFKKTWIETL